MWMEPTQGRWVCPRCFESNEADADRCASCGLERGADPAAAPVAGAPAATGAEGAGAQPSPVPPATPWAAPAAPAQRAPWLQYVMRYWWIGLLVIGGAIAGVNYLMGSRAVTDLKAGDCFDLPDSNEDVIDDLTQRDCTEPHEFEMFYVADLPDGPFPSEDEISAWVDANCLPAFAEYVGISFDSSVLSGFPIYPTEETWNSGDHSVQCALYEDGNPELTTSMRGAAR